MVTVTLPAPAGQTPSQAYYVAGYEDPDAAVEAVVSHIREKGIDVDGVASPMTNRSADDLKIEPGTVRMM